jgi:hypothetical protein
MKTLNPTLGIVCPKFDNQLLQLCNLVNNSVNVPSQVEVALEVVRSLKSLSISTLTLRPSTVTSFVRQLAVACSTNGIAVDMEVAHEH